jgi:hypothetical protein
MTAEAKKAIQQAVKKADEKLAADGDKAFAKAADALEMKSAATKPEAPKAPEAAKGPKEKAIAASAIQIDTADFEKKVGKKPGTGKRDPKAVWKFLIGSKAVEFATEFYRDAKAKAIEAAIAAKVTKIAVMG